MAKRTIPDKILRDRAYEIARNCGYDGYQRKVWSISLLIKKIESRISVNEQLAEELYKRVTTKFKRRKVCAKFKYNTWAADLLEMESLSSKNKNVKYLLFVIDVSLKTHGLNL